MDTLYAPDDAADMDCHISAVDHKTTRLCSLVSSWIDTGEMHKIQWNNTNKIQHKRCKNWSSRSDAHTEHMRLRLSGSYKSEIAENMQP